jgi:presenilin-like A22 family membrane protease
MLNIILILLQFVFNAIKYLLGFLVIVTLGIVGAVMYAIPWLLRVAALLLWLTAVYIGFTTIQTIYAPFSPAIPVIALQFAVILASVGWVLIVMGKNTNFVWGGMAAVGLVIGGASIGSIWLLDHWQHADLFFRVLPPAMFAALLVYETTRLRSLRSNQTDKEIVDDTEEITAQ